MDERDDEIDERVHALVARQLHHDRRIGADVPLRDLGLDSTALLSLVVRLEETFDIEIDDGDITLDHFGTLGAMSAYVAGRRS